jgi:hypothetical protein
MRKITFFLLPFIILFGSCTRELELRITKADVTWKYDAGYGYALYLLKQDTIIYTTMEDTVGYLSADGRIIRKFYDSTFKNTQCFGNKDNLCKGSVVTRLKEWNRYHRKLVLPSMGPCAGGIIDNDWKASVSQLELKGGKKIKILWDDKGEIGINFVSMMPYKDKLIISFDMNEHRYIGMVDLHSFLKEHKIEYDWNNYQ